MPNFIGNTSISQSYQSYMHVSSSIPLDGTGSVFTAPYVDTVFKVSTISGSGAYTSTTSTGLYSLASGNSLNQFRFGVYKHNMLVFGAESSLPSPVTGSIIFYDEDLYLGIDDTLPY